MAALSLPLPPRLPPARMPSRRRLEELSAITSTATIEDKIDAINLFNRIWDIKHNNHPCSVYEGAHLWRDFVRLIKADNGGAGMMQFAIRWIKSPGVLSRERRRELRQQRGERAQERRQQARQRAREQELFGRTVRRRNPLYTPLETRFALSTEPTIGNSDVTDIVRRHRRRRGSNNASSTSGLSLNRHNHIARDREVDREDGDEENEDGSDSERGDGTRSRLRMRLRGGIFQTASFYNTDHIENAEERSENEVIERLTNSLHNSRAIPAESGSIHSPDAVDYSDQYPIIDDDEDQDENEGENDESENEDIDPDAVQPGEETIEW